MKKYRGTKLGQSASRREGVRNRAVLLLLSTLVVVSLFAMSSTRAVKSARRIPSRVSRSS